MNNKIIFAIYLLITFFISLNLNNLNGFLFFIFSLFIGVTTLLYQPKETDSFKIPKYLIIIPIIIFLVSRFLPFYLYGPHPLGYDTGFYKYNIIKERTHDFGNLHLSEVESTGSRIAVKCMIALGLNDDIIMYWFYILTGFLTGLMIFLITKLYFNETTAFFSTYLYSVSFIQYLFYWNMFWKNSLALFLLLLIFYLIEKKSKYSIILAIPIIFFVFITHKTSAFLLFFTLFIYYLFKNDKNKRWVLPILLTGALIVAWNNKETIIYLWQQLMSGFTAHYDFFMVKEGIFISGNEFLKLSFLYLPFGIIGMFLAINREKTKNLTLTLIFSLLCVILIIIKFTRIPPRSAIICSRGFLFSN